MKKVFLLVILMFYSSLLLSQISDLNVKSEQLVAVKKAIQTKEQEKRNLVIQEKKFKKELEDLNNNISITEKKINQCMKDITIAQKKFQKVSELYGVAFFKNKDCDKSMQEDINFLNKITFVLPYEKDPIEYKVRKFFLEDKKIGYDIVQKEINSHSSELKKWQDAKNKFINLQKNEQSLMVKHQCMVKENNRLLNTTIGKLVSAQHEIKTLNDSARAMQNLIDKIITLNKQQHVSSSIQDKRKKSLPWPLLGKVIVNFGKSKHPNLATHVISNGIKIKTTDFNKVKSIDSGVVVFAGIFRSYGKVVIVSHSGSLFSIYGLLSNVYVKQNQEVLRGDIIASVGSNKDSILYLEIRKNNVPENPLLYLQ